jgi:hypothetical protein
MSFVKAFFKYLDKTIFGMGLLTFWIIWGILTIGFLALIPYGNTNISLIYLFVMLSIFFIKLFDSIFFAGSESFRDFINHFSIKAVFELFTTIWTWTPIVLTYIVVPLILVTYIGAWVFLIFPIWAIGNYVFLERSAKKREHMPMLDNSEELGIIMFVLVPTFLSFIGTLVYYLVVVNEYTSNIISTFLQ